MIDNKKRDFIKPTSKKLENKDLDIINKNIIILIKQLNKINKHLSRIDYDIGIIKKSKKNNEKEKGEEKQWKK